MNWGRYIFLLLVAFVDHFLVGYVSVVASESSGNSEEGNDPYEHTRLGYTNYTTNPIQIAAFCCDGHYTVFPMFLFSMANTYNITKETVARREPLPLNVTVFMDGMCYNQLKKCLTKLQTEYFPFNIIHKKHNEDKQLEYQMISRFFCATYKMHVPFMSAFDGLRHVMVIDLDVSVNHKIDDMWQDLTVRHYDPTKALYAALEISNTSTDGLITYPNMTNGWYVEKKKTQYYPPTGLNTGIMLMNLPLLRKLNFTVANLIANNTEDVSLADQDYINTWAYYHQDVIGVLNCKYNIRKGSNCMSFIGNETQQTYQDLFNQYENATVFHASNGYCARGYLIFVANLVISVDIG